MRARSRGIVRNVRRLAGLVTGALLLTWLHGCAAPQTSALQAHPPPLPRRIELDAVPYFAQQAHQCGPAALAMALAANGLAVEPAQLEPQIYLPGREGSLQVEMLAAARRQGFLAYPLAPQLRDVLAEVGAGRPVVVLQNLAFNWYPMWHYAVVVGYDLDRADIILRSGPERRQALPMATFEHTWARSGHWAMLVLAPGELPQNADETRYIAAAVALEQTQQETAANAAYGAALQRWPDNLGAWMGIGNIAYRRGDFVAAAAAFRSAAQKHPDAAAAFNNLADTLAQQKKYAEARAAAQRAIALGGIGDDIYRQTLREIETRAAAEPR